MFLLELSKINHLSMKLTMVIIVTIIACMTIVGKKNPLLLKAGNQCLIPYIRDETTYYTCHI